MKHKYLPSLLVLLILVLGSTVIVRNDLIATSYINTHENQARAKAFTIANALKAHHFVKGFYPATEYAFQSNYFSLCLQELVESRFLDAEGLFDDDSKCTDWVGVPYNLQIRGVTLSTNDFNKAFGETTDDAIVWSSGENGINENCKGDDVVGSFPSEKKRILWCFQLR